MNFIVLITLLLQLGIINSISDFDASKEADYQQKIETQSSIIVDDVVIF